MTAPSVLRELMSHTDVMVAARRVRENDVPVTRAALRGTIKRAMPGRTDLDNLVRAVLAQLDAFSFRTGQR